MNRAVLIQLGKAIRLHREALGITQEDLADRSNFHRTYIGQVERGERNPSFISILALTEALEIMPATLLDSYQKINSEKKND
jgi:transcriptional regulator with XRE-family HTH domain